MTLPLPVPPLPHPLLASRFLLTGDCNDASSSIADVDAHESCDPSSSISIEQACMAEKEAAGSSADLGLFWLVVSRRDLASDIHPDSDLSAVFDVEDKVSPKPANPEFSVSQA